VAIKTIQTAYKGYKFRSRLEARWAVFFDAFPLKWEYEPEGYDLGAPRLFVNPGGEIDADCFFQTEAARSARFEHGEMPR